MTKKNKAADKRSELFITRIFDAGQKEIWRAWSEPKQLMRWWGPKGFTAPFCEIDFRNGGKFLACMRSPEGKDYWSTGMYRELVPFTKIVCTDSFSDEKGNVVSASEYGMASDFPLEMLITVNFEDHEGKTKMTLEHSGIPEKMKEETKAGWDQSFDKLSKSLKD